jgi:hypothetical protein
VRLNRRNRRRYKNEANWRKLLPDGDRRPPRWPGG